MNALALAGLLAVQWAEPPYLAPGDRVRVHALHQPTLLEMPLPQLQRVTYGGTLTFYAAGDRLALERDKFLGTYPSPATVEFNWIHVHRIDVPAGTNWLTGAAKGAGYALIGAGTASLICSLSAGLVENCGFWENLGRISLVTVPVGALIGSRFTRWKPVYKRQR